MIIKSQISKAFEVDMNSDSHCVFSSIWGDNLVTDGSKSIFDNSKSKPKIEGSSTYLECSSVVNEQDDDSVCIQELADHMEDFIWLYEMSECSIQCEYILNESPTCTNDIHGYLDGKRSYSSFFDSYETIFIGETKLFLQENDDMNQDENIDEFLDYFNDSVILTKQRVKTKLGRRS
jgi:hypothetical protein